MVLSNLKDIQISAIKNNFRHPLLAYNFFIDNIPGVLNVHCQASSLPQVNLSKIGVKFRGRELYYNGTISKFEDWTVTVREDIYFRARTALEHWHRYMASRTGHYGLITPMVTRDLTVYMLAPGINIPVATYTLFNAFPHTLGDITVNQDSDEEVVTYDVTFSIDAWERQDVGFSDLIKDAGSGTGMDSDSITGSISDRSPV